MYPLYVVDEKEGAEDSVYRSTISVGMTGKEDKARAMDIWPVYSIKKPIEKDWEIKVRNLSSKFLCLLCFDKPGF